VCLFHQGQSPFPAGTETLAAGGPASFQNTADFYSKEEMAAFAKPKKRVKKKLRKKAGVNTAIRLVASCMFYFKLS
jgi:hypothetical protein